MKEKNNLNLTETLAAIAKTEPHPLFGEPFSSAFAATYPGGRSEETMVAAYICSLFLSTILEGFPTEKLHTFVNYTKENCHRFTFDCKMYDSILDKMNEKSLQQVALIGKNGSTIFRACSKEEIKEAFDFYTNR